DSVQVVANREDARIVEKSLFAENVQGPERPRGDRPAGRAISYHPHSGRLLDCVPRPQQVIAESLRGELVNRMVPETVARQLMPPRVNFAHQLGKFLRYPAQGKKRTLDLKAIEQIQHPMGVGDHAAWPAVPIRPGHDLAECFYLEVIFHVHRENKTATLAH